MITIQAYLMSLGLSRVTSRMDPSVRIVWDVDDTIHLIRDGSIRDERDYLLHDWHPTPITSPWNNGGGYDGDKYLDAIENSITVRLASYRRAISAGRHAYKQSDKADVIRCYRNIAPDAAVLWVDACQVEQSGGEWLYNPLLGSGGNDGRLDFSRTYMRALMAVMDPETGEPTPEAATWIDCALGLRQWAPPSDIPGGQFFGGDRVNPWLYILAIEGCLFTSATHWRYRTDLSHWAQTADLNPAGLPTATAADCDEGAEIWLPVWREPLSIAEITELLGDQRLEYFGHQPEDGVQCTIAAARSDLQWLRVIRTQGNGRAHILTVAQS